MIEESLLDRMRLIRDVCRKAKMKTVRLTFDEFDDLLAAATPALSGIPAP